MSDSMVEWIYDSIRRCLPEAALADAGVVLEFDEHYSTELEFGGGLVTVRMHIWSGTTYTHSIVRHYSFAEVLQRLLSDG